jgi:hypothetical protein
VNCLVPTIVNSKSANPMKSKKPKPGRVLLIDKPLQVHCPSLETREAHEFDPNGRGLCSICHLPKNVLEHKRWQERAYEEAQAAHDALHDRSKQEAEDRATRDGAKRMKVGDRVYRHDMENGERSGFYPITSIRTEEYVSVTGRPDEETIFALEGEDMEEISMYELDFPPFPPGWIPVKDRRDTGYTMEESNAEMDRLLDSWKEVDMRLIRARDAFTDYE